MKRHLRYLVPLAVLAAAVITYWATRPAHALVFTGIVTTDDVIVSSEIQGRLQQLAVREGDTVKAGQLLGEEAVLVGTDQQAWFGRGIHPGFTSGWRLYARWRAPVPARP